MASKMIAVLVVICILQGIQSKSFKPFWGMNPFLTQTTDPTLDPELQAIVTEIQTRLNQVSTISKSTVGRMVGMGSKKIGLMTSQVKNSIKLAVNNVQNNPSVTKDCLTANQPTLDALSKLSESQVSVCAKSSQIQLKSMNQVQKEISLQTSTLSSETNVIVSQCRLEHPLPTETADVTECVKTKADDIKTKIVALEQQVLQTVSAVQTGATQITGQAETCGQQVQAVVQQQLDIVSKQLEQCSASAVAPAI